jgi:hypothetical protein
MPSGTRQMTKVGNCQEISTRGKVFYKACVNRFFDFNQDKWGETKRHSWYEIGKREKLVMQIYRLHFLK